MRLKRKHWLIPGLLALSMLAGLWLSCGSDRCNCAGPEPREPRMTYLFREATAACDACDFCDYEYWYFEMAGDSCNYTGHWDPGDGSPAPPWYDAMRPVEQCYDTEYRTCADSAWAYCWDPGMTPRGNKEAEEAAIWLSGSLVAPESLYNVLLGDLSTIRQQYGDSIPQLRTIAFSPYVVSDELVIKLVPEAFERLARGDYHDLDSLNALYRMTEMRPMVLNRWFVLTFDGRYHGERLADIYDEVESLEFVHPNTYVVICFPSTVIPWLVE